jgi:hypothetical protein
MLDHKVIQVTQELKGLKVIQVMLDLRVVLEIKEIRGLKVI